MRTETLPSRTGVPLSAPDPAFAARPRLARLRDALVAAARRSKPRRRRWGEPPVFFFDPARQAELEAARPPVPQSAPDLVTELIAAELPLLCESVEVRRVARAVPGLLAAAEALPEGKDLAALLAVPDDETLLVLYPARQAGYRLLVRGIADVNQFHLLMLDALTGDPSDGLLPGPPVPARLSAACRAVNPGTPAGVPMVAEGRFQLFRPAAVQPGGTVPDAFRGCDHWLWGWEPLAAVPRVDGERVVVLGEPAFRTTWEVERRFPGMAAGATLLDVLSPFQVVERLSRLAGRPVPVRTDEPREEGLARAA